MEKPDEEQLSRAEEREKRNRIRTIKEAGLDSLRPMYSFSGATSFGGFAATRDINVYLSKSARTSTMGRMTTGDFTELDAYVRFDGYDAARHTLETNRVLVLRGEERNGRSTSALSLLTALVGDNVLDLGQEWNLDSLFSDDLEHHRGYLLQKVPGSKVKYLAQAKLGRAERALARAQSYLVITVPDRTDLDYGDLERYMVDHPAPDPHELLRSHLHRLCPELIEQRGDWLEDSRLCEWVDVAEPKEIVHVAATLADSFAADASLEDSLRRLPAAATAQARRLLCGTDQADPDLRPTELLQRRALVVALAVFDNTPYLPVAAAAESLTQFLTTTAFPKGTPHRQIFTLRRDNSLKWLQGTIAIAADTGEQAKQRPGNVYFKNRDLPNAILNEVWHQYDAARTPILRWLRDLATSRNEEVRIRAAQAVGKLATDDFQFVYDEVIYGWAGSRMVAERQAAAWALEAAVRTGDVEKLVRKKLSDWCRGGSRFRKLTAVMAYGTGIGADRPQEALRNLRYLARSDDREMARIAYNSVADLFDSDKSDEILDTLQEWSIQTSDPDRQFGVSSLTQIAYLSDFAGRRKLLLACAGDDSRAPLLLGLWRRGLKDDQSRADAWEALGQWCKDADRDAELVAPLHRFLNSLESMDETLRERIDWYLNYWSTYAKERSVAAAAIRSDRKDRDVIV